MSSRSRTVQVTTVRTQQANDKRWVVHKDNISVSTTKDAKSNKISMRVLTNKKTLFSGELDVFEWTEESSSPGVAVICSKDINFLFTYDLKDRELLEFFDDIKHYLEEGPTPAPPEPPSPEVDDDTVIDNLLKSIKDGAANKAEQAVKSLVRNRTNVGFNLIDPNAQKENQSKARGAAAAATSNVLELKLQVECHLNRKPIVETIYVPSGTKLKALKKQIEDETGIDSGDQYWYAFGKYLISDDYEFGSTKPVVPRVANAPKKQDETPTKPICSHDTVIMYIAKLLSYK